MAILLNLGFTMLCILMIISLVLNNKTSSQHYKGYKRFHNILAVVMFCYAIVYLILSFTVLNK